MALFSLPVKEHFSVDKHLHFRHLYCYNMERAKVKLIHDFGDIGKAIEECLNLALRMQREDPNVYVPRQFDNPNQCYGS